MLALALAGAAAPPQLSSLLLSAAHQAALLDAARAADPPGMPACTMAHYATTGEVGMVEPLRVNAAGRIVGGAWKEQIRETGCGPDRVLNALSEAAPDGRITVQPLLPGSTITDLRLQADSVPVAAEGMGELPTGCDAGGVADTRFDQMDGLPPGEPPKSGETLRPWTETWTLQACDKRVAVTLRFTPEADGTGIKLLSPRG